MTSLDLIVFAAIALSTLVAYVRGVVREIVALASWIAGFVAAMRYADVVAASLAWLDVAPAAPVAAAPAQGEGFAVQIAAFTDDKGANALATKLKKAGYASTYTEPAETSRGTMWRVRVGGFATRPDAEAARAKLKAEGWNGLVVASK